jgi:hypothetical protein
MSEYIEISTEEGDDTGSLYIYTNLRLTDGEIEEYESPQEMELGSPLAQALAVVSGLSFLRLDNDELFIRRQPDADWHAIIEDITSVLKDFFL